jgi:hypothetical protein
MQATDQTAVCPLHGRHHEVWESYNVRQGSFHPTVQSALGPTATIAVTGSTVARPPEVLGDINGSNGIGSTDERCRRQVSEMLSPR